MDKRIIIANTGLNQFDSNPTDSPDLMEMIADSWIEKALYYGIRKCGGFSWRESWVVVDGITYNISINNTSIVGNRDCASLEIELRKLRENIDKAIEEIEQTLYVDSLIFGELIDFKNGKISANDVIEKFNRVTRKEVLEILKRNIGE